MLFTIGLTLLGLFILQMCRKSSNDNPIDWDKAPDMNGSKLKKQLRISTTITPDNPIVESDWHLYIHNHYITGKN